MSGSGNGQRRRYRVSFSGKIAKVIAELRYEAFLLSRLEEFDRAWRIMWERLSSDPLQFGELVQPYHHLQMKAHVGSVYPITIQFGIHESLPLVFIVKVIFAK